MKVFALMGSPRKGGNSDALMDAAMMGICDVRPDVLFHEVRVSDVGIEPCDGCGECCRNGKCHIKDKMQNIYKWLERVDIVLVATPIYFMGPPSTLKCMIDRTFCIWSRKVLLKRKGKRKKRGTGALLASAGDKDRKMFRSVISNVKALFWTIGVRYSGQILASGMDSYRSVKERPALLVKAKTLGKKLALSVH